MSEWTRRDFMITAAGAGLSTAVLPAFGGWYQGASDVVRVGVIGCGGRGTGAAVNALEAHPSTKIVALADLGSGSRVLEAGVGSGALTCYLLRATGVTGQVISVERRSDFAEQARENVARWFGGLPNTWELIEGDLAELTDEQVQQAQAGEGLDAVILDMLAPWECLDVADRLLRPGGALVGYVATTTQLSRLVETMRLSRRWTEPRAEESIVRTWHLDGLAVRPDHRMSGHTGFLVAARHMAPGQEAPERKRRPAPGAYGEDYAGPGSEAAQEQGGLNQAGPDQAAGTDEPG